MVRSRFDYFYIKVAAKTPCGSEVDVPNFLFFKKKLTGENVVVRQSISLLISVLKSGREKRIFASIRGSFDASLFHWTLGTPKPSRAYASV